MFLIVHGNDKKATRCFGALYHKNDPKHLRKEWDEVGGGRGWDNLHRGNGWWRLVVGIRGKEPRHGTDEEAAQEVLMKGFTSSLPHETRQPIPESSESWNSLTFIRLVIKLLLSSTSFSAKSEMWEVSVTYYMTMTNLIEKLRMCVDSLFTYLNLLAFSSMIY